MFKDAREELKRLEEELLQEEETGEEVYEDDELSDYDPERMYNGDDVDADSELADVAHKTLVCHLDHTCRKPLAGKIGSLPGVSVKTAYSAAGDRHA